MPKNIYNITLPFIKFYIGYEVLKQISSKDYHFQDKIIYNKFCEKVESLLSQIDEKYILEQKNPSYKIKIFTLSRKYHKDLRYDIIFENQSLMYSNYRIIDFKKSKDLIIWKILEIKDKILHIEGKDNFWMPREKYFYFCKIGNKTFFPKYFYSSNDDFITIYGDIEKGRIVIFDIQLEKINIQIFHFYISYNDKIIEIFPTLGCFSHIPPIINGYYVSENHIAKYINRSLTIFIKNKYLLKVFEDQYCKQLKKEGKNNIIKLRKENIKYKNQINKKEIWIISDRPDKAGDNGEYFFRYLKAKNIKGIIFYFVIRKNCSDYKRLKKLGNILDSSSENYFDIFLKSDKILSSMPNSWVDEPFCDYRKYIIDLFHFDLIYLQNRKLKNDLSKHLNRLKNNYSLLITSTKKEYKSITQFNYGYNKNNIILTGLPRYDNLYRLNKIIKRKKTILIAPTWRSFIKGTINRITYESIYSDNFKFTDYFNFYNSLINHPKLITLMEKYNYKGILCLHPFFSSQDIDFTRNQIFSIKNICNYQKNILISSLLVTDYSSIFFDFAYLRKPVIYTHFDNEIYRRNQNRNGYFNYEKYRFGSITHDLESTIDKIIDEIENNCLLKKKYLKRVNKFFTFFDENNNDRLYFELLHKKIVYHPLKGSFSTILFLLFLLIYVKVLNRKNIIS